MKCAKIKGEKEFFIDDIKIPEKDGNNVIIEVSKAGICGSDIHYWVSGEPVGLVMGHEFSGKVIDPGSRRDIQVNDRVTALPISPCGNCRACNDGNPQYCLKTWDNAVGLSLNNPGAYTEVIKVRPDMVVKIPDGVSDIEGAMVEPVAVGLHAVHLANIQVGEKVLVIGGGIIGVISAMFARMEGASYVALAEVNEGRGNKAVSLKVADEFINTSKEDYLKIINEKVGEGFDVVIECCGNDPAVSTAIMSTRPGGKIILVGVSQKPITIPTVVSVLREITMIGSIGYTKEEFITSLELIANKKIDVSKFVDKVLPLLNIQEAYEELTNGVTSSIKIIIDHKA